MDDPITAIEAHRRRVDAMNGVGHEQLPPNHTSLDYLQAVYRGQIEGDPTRMRAAISCLQFEHPKLSAAAVMHDDGTWAERLEKAIERSERVRLNGEGAKPKVIEHSGLRRL
jgi:hypothetical protein